MCTAFSQMQNINKNRRDPKDIKRELDDAKDHIRFVMSICATQWRENRYFLFEHPDGASWWDMPEVKKIREASGVETVHIDMCAFGMTEVDDDGIRRPVQKGTRLLTNSPEVAIRVAKRCTNRSTDKEQHHRHCKLEGGRRCKKAQLYQRAFCRAVCEGVAAQRNHDSMNLSVMTPMDANELMEIGLDDLHEPNDDDFSWIATDDISGEDLDPKLLRAARQEELQYFKDMKVYEYAQVSECLKATGRPPIGVRWVDTNKGDRAKPNYRARLVAKEYRVEARPDLFAATPPTECMRMLASKCAEDKSNKMLYIDISRAYFYAKSIRPTYVRLPPEDGRSGEEGLCAKLLMSMYGTRDAAQNWAEEYTATLVKAGFTRGVSNPCLYYNPKTEVSVMVHGDDFLTVGSKTSTDALKKTLMTAYKVKCEFLGGGEGEVSEIRVLNRVVRRTGSGLTIEADPRHAEMVIKDLELTTAKEGRVPGSKEGSAQRKPE